MSHTDEQQYVDVVTLTLTSDLHSSFMSLHVLLPTLKLM